MNGNFGLDKSEAVSTICIVFAEIWRKFMILHGKEIEMETRQKG